MAGGDTDVICTEASSSTWRTWFIISATVNVMILTQFLLSWTIKLVSRRRQLPCMVNQQTKINHFKKHRLFLAALCVDSVLLLVLFGGAFYLLINGAVENPFVIGDSSLCHVVSVTTVFCSMSIGRLCVAIFMGFTRLRVISTPKVVTPCMRLILEQMFLLTVTVLLLSSSEALLTKALLLIMTVDQNLSSLSVLVQICPRYNEKDDELLVKVKVVQCFLSIAFRGAVPLVCLVVSLTVYDHGLMDMSVMPVAVVVASAVVYVVYSPWVIVATTRDMWRLCVNQHGGQEKNPDTFFTHNPPARLNNSVSLEFDIKRNNHQNLHIVNKLHQNDCNKYLQLTPPTCYCKNQADPNKLCLICRRTQHGINVNDLINSSSVPNPVLTKESNPSPQEDKPQHHKSKHSSKLTRQVLQVAPSLQAIPEETDSMVDVPL